MMPATAKYEAVVRRVCCMSDRGRAIVMYPENWPGVLVVHGDDEGAPAEAGLGGGDGDGMVRKEETGAELVSTRSGRWGLPEALRVSSE